MFLLPPFRMDDEKFMRIAIEEAKKGDYPFGAVIVKDNKILVKAHNSSAGSIDPTAHAEINAIRQACKKLNTKYLSECTLYATCEPCPMCFTAAWWAQIPRIVYGAKDADVPEDEWKINVTAEYLNKKSRNKIQINGEFLRAECLKLFD
jgi:tRNA(Arg) A34 adenosine deaminase TadA